MHLQPRNVGLAQQWLGVWAAAEEHEAAFVFEDDVEVLFRVLVCTTTATTTVLHCIVI